MTREKPDRFGPYRETMEGLHTTVHRALCLGWGTEPDPAGLAIHQMSLSEHEASDHHRGYLTHRLQTTMGPLNAGETDFVLVCVNQNCPEGRRAERDLDVIVGLVEAPWRAHDPEFRLVHRGLAPLGTEGQDDTIQTVHFLFGGDQAFKILYPYKTVGRLLEATRGGKPSIRRADEISPSAYNDYMLEWEQAGETIIPMSSSRNGRSFDKMQRRWAEGQTEKAFETGFVPNSVFFLVEERGRILGALSFRHQLNERLLQNGGHIGYGIRPSERRKGHAKAFLKAFLASEHAAGIDRFLITCDEDNLASQKTIESAGGLLGDKVEWDGVWTRRYWIGKRLP